MIKNKAVRKALKNAKNFAKLSYNYVVDFNKFYRESTVFTVDNLEKKESLIILHYHAIEKGFLYENPKPRFGIYRIEMLHSLLNDPQVINAKGRSQISVAYRVLCQYYELHVNKGVSIEDFFSKKQYEKYLSILGETYSNEFRGAISFQLNDFYKNNNENFHTFSHSRKSIRTFTGEKVPIETIKDAIRLALNAPSVCNRQASKVYLLEDKAVIDKVLAVQGGMRGYSEKVAQLLILTTDRSYFFSVGERNQLFIDGGIFLMNLLYALHFYRIANCPANWGKTVDEDKIVSKYVAIPESEKIICMIPIGVATDNFKVCLSQRRSIDEVLKLA